MTGDQGTPYCEQRPTFVKEGPSLHQQIEERPSPGPEILLSHDQRSAQLCLPGMVEETDVHAMGSALESTTIQPNYPSPTYLRSTHLKALELWELWKAQIDLPWI